MSHQLIDKNHPQFGYIDGEVFIKTVPDNASLYKRLNGWALDKVSIEKARSLGIKYCAIIEKKSSRLYIVTLENFFKLAISIHFAGYGAQLVLPLEHWTILENVNKNSVSKSLSDFSIRQRQNHRISK